MKKITISEKDLKLLFLLLSLLIIAASYFLIYTSNMKKTEAIKTENQQLQTRLDALKSKQTGQDSKIKGTNDLTAKIKVIADQFPAAIQTEDAIVMINDLEQSTGCTISSVNFKMNELFYPTNATGTSATAASSDTSGAASTGTTASNTASSATSTAGTTATDTTTTGTTTGSADQTSLEGYKSSVTFAYQSTYTELKQIIDYINKNQDRMSISAFSSAFDASTGNLIGSFTVDMYSLSGTGKQYQEPEVSGINTGLNNIFGTMEIEKKAKKTK